MRKLVIIAAVIALAACNKAPPPPAANDIAATPDANLAEAAPAGTALASIDETSWEFTQKGKPMQESVDANGKYITVSGKEHIDHGTAVMKDGKACFTSLMDKEGQVCWTDPKVAVGGSGETTSDKGEKLVVKRVAYVPLTM